MAPSFAGAPVAEATSVVTKDPFPTDLSPLSPRWTVVDTFQRGSERYIVARDNWVSSPDLSLLTAREQQIVVRAALGRSSKEAAHELGITHATARVLLSRAYRRLGVRTQRELLRLPSIRQLSDKVRDEGSSTRPVVP